MADHFHDPDTTDTEASVTTRGPGQDVYVSSVEWSYSGTPTGGAVVIESPVGTPIWRMFVTSGGPGQFHFEQPKRGASNESVKVRLLAAGNIKGTLAVTTKG